MKKSQEEYFSKGIITKKIYEIRVSKYKERIAEIKRNLPVLKNKLEKLSKMKRII